MVVDIYFPAVESFWFNASNKDFVINMQTQQNQTPCKFIALGAVAFQERAVAANDLNALDQETIAQRIHAGTFKTTCLASKSSPPTVRCSLAPTPLRWSKAASLCRCGH
jgi:hypothetical protein